MATDFLYKYEQCERIQTGDKHIMRFRDVCWVDILEHPGMSVGWIYGTSRDVCWVDILGHPGMSVGWIYGTSRDVCEWLFGV